MVTILKREQHNNEWWNTICTYDLNPAPLVMLIFFAKYMLAVGVKENNTGN